MPRPKAQPGDDTLLGEARARFKLGFDADAHNRKRGEDDIRFAYNFDGDNQWDQVAKDARTNRPQITENHLPQSIHQVVNGIRAARPSITVLPASGEATVATAEVREGMCRNIETASCADLAYDTAAECAITSGVGYLRVTTDYVDDNTFDQELTIRTIDNPFTVVNDPKFSQPDGSDRQWCFVTEMVDPRDFEAKYGFAPTELTDASDGEDFRLWWDEKDVRVAEYHRVTYESTQISDPADATRKRTVRTPTVEVYVMTGDTIVERAKYPGCKLIGIVPVFGELKRIGGQLYTKSLIHDAKTMQQLVNYYVSAQVESVALQPKVPTVGPTGSFQTDAGKWNNPAGNYPIMEYDPVLGPDGQTIMPPPQRQQPPAFPEALRELQVGALEGMKATIGLYNASLPDTQPREVSGIAIEQRQNVGDVSTFHFPDNVVRAVRLAGLVLNERMPLVYDRERVVRIIKPDNTPAMVAINQTFVIDPTTYEKQPGLRIDNGRYDVVVKAGPSYATQRQETQYMLWQMVKAYPQLMQSAGDLLFKSMDFQGADEIAKRLAPQGQQLPPQVQLQIQQMTEALQAGKQKINDLQGLVSELQQTVNEQNLDLKRKDITIAGKDLAIRDKSATTAVDMHGTMVDAEQTAREQSDSNQKFIIDTVLKLMALQQKQQMPVTQEAQAMRPEVERLVQ